MTNQPNPNKQKIIDLRQQGLSYGSISKLVGLSRARVHQISSGYNPDKNYRDNELRQFIFKRDNFTCQWGEYCKNEKVDIKSLLVHHIDFDDRNNNPKNLITLCRKCHSAFHRNNHIDDKIEKKLNNNNKIKIRKCVVCGKELIENRKTCSKECLNRLIQLNSLPREERYKRYRDRIDKWQKKRRQDPEYVEMKKKKCKEYYYRKKLDKK